MRWASFDTFLTEDRFWQEKMGKPFVNKEFLRALLRYGSFESYHFFLSDTYHCDEFRDGLRNILSGDEIKRVRVSLQVQFFEEIHKKPPHIMHQGDFTYHMPYLIEFRNRQEGIPPFPVTGVTHSLDRTLMHTRFMQILLSRPRPFDTVICTSLCSQELLVKAFQHIREALAEAHGCRLPMPPSLVRIPLALSEEAFLPQDTVHCREKLGIPSHHLVILSLARFSPRHKMDLTPLLECIQWLKQKGSLQEFTLVLAGSGNSSDINLVRDMISRLGLTSDVLLDTNVASHRKLLLYGAADIFTSLVDNFQETFGLTILEAMAQGIPVIASDFDGYKDLIENGETGYLISTYLGLISDPWEGMSGLLPPSILRFHHAQKVACDMEELATTVLALASNPQKRKEMGGRARARALNYKWGQIIPEYEELWKDLAEKAALAGTSPGASEFATPPLLHPGLTEYFSHYPTSRISPDTRVALSDYGKDRLHQGFRPIMYRELQAVLSESALMSLIGLLGEKERKLEDLLGSARAETGLSEHTVILHLDWLMKHGYIKVPEIRGRDRAGAHLTGTSSRTSGTVPAKTIN